MRRRSIGRRTLTNSEFVDRAVEIHGLRYDYEEVVYLGIHTPIKIGCMIHGWFWQTPNSHLNGQGCTECFRMRLQIKGMNRFFDEGRRRFGYTYDYFHVRYVDMDTPVKIICPVHDEFWQKPRTHIDAMIGCPYCSDEGNSDRVRRFRHRKKEVKRGRGRPRKGSSK